MGEGGEGLLGGGSLWGCWGSSAGGVVSARPRRRLWRGRKGDGNRGGGEQSAAAAERHKAAEAEAEAARERREKGLQEQLRSAHDSVAEAYALVAKVSEYRVSE